MARPTDREVRIVAAYLSGGSWKAAACELGIRPETARHRAGRILRRHGCTNVAQLVLVMADELRRTDTDAPLVACVDAPDD